MKRVILLVFIALGASSSYGAADESVPFRLYRGYFIVVRCSVSKENVTAIIDTGVSETVADMRLVKRLSLPTWADSATFLTKDAEVRGVSIPDIHIGPVKIEKLDGIAADLSALAHEIGVRPDILIGMDVLHRANFVIDYHARVLTFGAHQVTPHGASLAPGSRFAVIDSTVLGKKLRLQVDTGFSTLLLYGSHMDRLANLKDTGTRVVGVGLESRVRTIELPEVQVGDWRGSHVRVSVIDDAPSEPVGFDGLLGPRVLGARRVAFDFENRMLFWD